MSGMKRRFLGLCLPPIPFVTLDLFLTLYGQPSAYWAGDYQQVRELGEFFNQLLQIHPMALIAFFCIEIILFLIFMMLVTDVFALWCSIAATFSGLLGASSWLVYFPHGYVICCGLFSLATLLLAIGIRYGWQARPSEKYEFKYLSPLWRSIIAIAIVAFFAYIAIWP